MKELDQEMDSFTEEIRTKREVLSDMIVQSEETVDFTKKQLARRSAQLEELDR